MSAVQKFVLRLIASLRRLGVTRAQASWVALVLSAIWMSQRLARLRARQRPELVISLSAAMRLLGEKRVQEFIYSDGGKLLLQLRADGGSRGSTAGTGARFWTHLVPGSEAHVFRLVQESGVPTFRYVSSQNPLLNVLVFLMPFAGMFAWYQIIKSMCSKDEKYTPARKRDQVPKSTSFADVVSKCKVELTEIVDCLNNPGRYKQAGARIPRGALLVGPSGTGKTLLARAVAGEARCNFVSASASEFVEVYVGRGAARVRDLFRQAREMAPAVLFIDELDALGTRTRGGDGRPVNEEYVQTLNQLLTELDGFYGRSDGVVVLAATNRHEAIDPSLLRPGRFDRHVFVELPDEDERLQILQIHSSKAPSTVEADEAMLRRVAGATDGFSGAELANLINEVVFLSMRRGKQQAESEDFHAAFLRARTMRQRAKNAAGENGAGLSKTLLKMWPTAAAR